MGKKLSTEPYKGVRDFYPEEQTIKDYIFDISSGVAEKFGYAKYSASIIEPTELYEVKTGEEIVREQTYTFADRGGRNVTLRPEMTPSIARMVAKKKRELSFPLRWYSIGDMFRYERPQKGRLREHTQINIDMFGSSSVEADIELIEIASGILRELGAKESNFEIRLNSRKILHALLTDCFGFDGDTEHEVMKLTDKKDKMEREAFEKEAESLMKGKSESYLKVLDAKSHEDVVSCFPNSLRDANTVKEVSFIIEKLQERGVSNVLFKPSLVRGFDYYTGLVFEIFDTDPKNSRSLFGGGRYDNLLQIFGGEDMPAVGFAMGDVTIKNLLEGRGLIPEYMSTTDLFICTVQRENARGANELARTLREKGMNVEVNFSDKKVPDQIKMAVKKSIPFIVCVGGDEEKTKKYTLKELSSGKETNLAGEEIPKFIFTA